MEHIEESSFRFARSRMLLAYGVDHGFFDASLDVGKPLDVEIEKRLLRTLKVGHLYLLDQVHGDTIVEVDDASVAPNATPADGWLLRRRDVHEGARRVAFGLKTADCLPLIMVSPSHIALVHAGWRGVCAGIVEKAARSMLRESAAGELKAALGPCASGEAYEVGAELEAKFGERGVFHYRNGKRFLDLPATVCKSLEKIGLNPRMIESSQECTIRSARYFSYRRDGSAAGRNLSFVSV